ncbi:TrkH-domain-containing protein [Rhizopus microsporus ATCC 52813]|uniref:TrkH-domain-containing protein n=1 Tax=Rhizopus microsporus ATCC 52813 TaxID=1340429 RepID=A0A2G4SUI9_RHIZD|nr:TrkH-domain-containing protein [Rhizopus microsporus ATCC 52813]PHZ12443.1 TrkH-domain-containing protein [Rhizopus microsporus ATCC 52813]
MLSELWETVKQFYNERVHFIQLHYLYILFLSLICSALLYINPYTNLDYIDALFMATSATTNTGLNTIALSSLSTSQLCIIYLGSFLSSHIMISTAVVIVRKHYFSKRFEDVLLFNKAQHIREVNQRKFERNVQQVVGHQQQNLRKPLHKRLSFLSVRSQQKSEQEPSESGRCRSMINLSGSLFQTQKPRSIDDDIRDYPNSNDCLFQESNKSSLKEDKESNNPSSSQCSYLTKEEPDQIQDALLHVNRKSRSSEDIQRGASQEENSSVNKHQDTLTTDGAGAMWSNQNIMFAGDIEQQREIARKRLEKERQCEDMIHKIANNDNPLCTSSGHSTGDSITIVNFDVGCNDDENIKLIKRGPIQKSELTREQRYRLGGAEYRALDLLSRLVPMYYIFFIVGFGFIIRSYIASSPYVQSVLLNDKHEPINAWGFSFFTSLASFNNLGLSQLDESMQPFEKAPFMLFLIMMLILAGNTAYAILLRLVIWIMYKITPQSYYMRRETLKYLLDHPRRCYTTLFPSYQTRWLLVVLVGITFAEFISFVALNYWLPVLEGVGWGTCILDGLFQSVTTRSAGYNVVDLMNLNPGTQITYIVAMYISVYPVAILMRNSNVYQERALGIYSRNNENEGFDIESNNSMPFNRLRRTNTVSSVVTASRRAFRGPDFYVRTQIQRQLTSEICWVIVCIFVICVVETKEIMSPSPITMSTVIYECVSAFGNIGSSIGYPNTPTSQVAQYHPISKFALIILMYRGRHRGLPAAIDRAVLLPSEQLEQKEEEEDMLRKRTSSYGDISPQDYYRCRTL